MDTFPNEETRKLLEQHGFKFSKAMGQNFLVDKNIPDKLVRLSGVDSQTGVLEIGPGLGPLTARLCETAGRVTAVELDGRLIPLLSRALEEYNNVDIIQGDILKLDINKLLQEEMPGMRYRACANLPYSITTPALSALIDSGAFESVTVMIQREVAKRICAGPGEPEYSAFTVYVNYYTCPKQLFDVPPECFIPRPKVYSSVITMETRADKPLEGTEEAMFFRVVRASFAQRRKTLVNALFASFGNSLRKSEIEEIVKECGFDGRVRGETLSIPDFMRVSSSISQTIANIGDV